MEDLEKVEFRYVLGAITEDLHLTRCAQVCFTGTEEDQAERYDQSAIDDVLGDQDWNKEKMSWKKLTEKLICLNRYLFLVTPRSKNNIKRLGFVFLAVPALQSDDYIETCDIYLEKHLCRCCELPELHKAINAAKKDLSMSGVMPRPRTHKMSPPRRFYVQSRSGSRFIRGRLLSWHSLLDP